MIKYVIKNMTKTSTAKKGKMAFAIVSTLSPETEEATNKTNPQAQICAQQTK